MIMLGTVIQEFGKGVGNPANEDLVHPYGDPWLAATIFGQRYGQ